MVSRGLCWVIVGNGWYFRRYGCHANHIYMPIVSQIWNILPSFLVIEWKLIKRCLKTRISTVSLWWTRVKNIKLVNSAVIYEKKTQPVRNEALKTAFLVYPHKAAWLSIALHQDHWRAVLLVLDPELPISIVEFPEI